MKDLKTSFLQILLIFFIVTPSLEINIDNKENKVNNVPQNRIAYKIPPRKDSQSGSYIQIPSTHPCYTNCMHSLKNPSTTPHPSQTHHVVDPHSIDAVPDEVYKPEGPVGWVYNALNDVVQGTAAITSSAIRAGAQLEMNTMKTANQIQQHEMEMEVYRKNNELDNTKLINEKEMQVQNDIYKEEQKSPFHNAYYDSSQYQGQQSKNPYPIEYPNYYKKEKKDII
jgi:hypothetical protein